MSRELILLRHGKSDWTTEAPTDFERPLAKRGRKDSRRVGRWLRHKRCFPDHVVASPALRAAQTVQRVCDELEVPIGRITSSRRIYEARADDLLAVLARCPPAARRVLLVGHNPGLEQLTEMLGGVSAGDYPDGKLIPTAALCRMVLPEDWSVLRPGAARLVEIVRPRSLRGQA